MPSSRAASVSPVAGPSSSKGSFAPARLASAAERESGASSSNWANGSSISSTTSVSSTDSSSNSTSASSSTVSVWSSTASASSSVTVDRLHRRHGCSRCFRPRLPIRRPHCSRRRVGSRSRRRRAPGGLRRPAARYRGSRGSALASRTGGRSGGTPASLTARCRRFRGSQCSWPFGSPRGSRRRSGRRGVRGRSGRAQPPPAAGEL